MNALRARDEYPGFLLSLRQQWAAVGVLPYIAHWTPLPVLEQIQRGPHDEALQENWLIQPSDALRIYLNKLDAIVGQHCHLTDVDTEAPAWWVRRELHGDVIKDAPRSWIDLVDEGRFEAPKPAPQLRIRVAGFGVRVTGHDPATDELVTTHLFDTLDAAVTFSEATLAQHCQDQGWQRNAASEAKMLEQDIPALVSWYVARDVPRAEPTRRRLIDIARDVLALDPPPTPNTHHPAKKEGRFFVRLSENSD
jgi:hypothetical protein